MVLRPQPFTLHVPDDDLTDLKARLARTRLPDQTPGAPWAYGTDLTYLRSLIEYWRTGFDWRIHEARLNAFPQFKVPLLCCGRSVPGGQRECSPLATTRALDPVHLCSR